jgi:flagellin
MALSINTNVQSLNAQRNLATSSRDLGRSLERLSSGLRINTAKDDAAGLAISTRMASQIRGMSQAVRNANDGVSMLQTADGTLATITESLQRVRELAVQAANGTNSAGDRAALMQEVRQRLDEIDRIGKSASFNGQPLFATGGGSIAGNTDQRAVNDGLRMGWLENAEKMIRQYYGIQGDGAAIQIDITQDTDGSGGFAAFVSSQGGGANGRGVNLHMSVDMANFTPANLPNGGSAPVYNDRIIAHEMVHAVMARATNWSSLTTTSMWFVEGAAEFIQGADERLAADIAAAAGGNQDAKMAAVVNEVASWQLTSADYSAGYVATRYLHDKLKSAGFTGGIKDFMTYLNDPSAPTMDQALTHFFGGGYNQASLLAEIQADSGNGLSNGVMFIKNHMNLTNADTGAVGGLDADGSSVKTADSVVEDIGSRYGDDVLQGFAETWETLAAGTPAVRTANLQVGGEVGQTIGVQVGAMSIDAMGLSEVDIGVNQHSAQRALIHLDAAIEYVGKQRAMLGAQLSRLDTAISSLQTGVENAAASNSRVVDADYAVETASLVRSQILQQAGTAIVAQANTLPQNVLALLRG